MHTLRFADYNWLNDRDQFLYPNDGWQEDLEFQSDCLAYTLFHGQNRITRSEGINHWIPFTEQEVDAPSLFESNFMTDYIQGRIRTIAKTETETSDGLFSGEEQPSGFEPKAGGSSGIAMQFSQEAREVFDAGRELWRYYMLAEHRKRADFNVNASLYDIRAFFQGFEIKPSGKRQMRTKSNDPTYTDLMAGLRMKLKHLAEKIKPKVYEYGFLRG